MRRNLYFLSLLLIPALAFSQSAALKNILNSDELDQCETKYEANGLTLDKIQIIKDSKISQRAYCFSFLPQLRVLLNKNKKVFRLLTTKPFSAVLLVTDEKKISYNEREGILTIDSEIDASIESQAISLDKKLQKEFPLFEFSGILKNLEVSSLTGWRPCHRSTYGDNFLLSQLKAECNGTKVLIACGEKNSAKLRLAAMGDKGEVFKNIGDTTNGVNNHNGVSFYLSDNRGMGFAALGTPVNRAVCDTAAPSPEDRMCWHTNSGTVIGGWRCGEAEALSGGNFERFVFTAD